LKTEEEIRKAVKESYSIAQTLCKIGLKPRGGNYRIIKKKIKEFNIDTSHFTGQGHLKGKTHQFIPLFPYEQILTENSHYQSFKLKNRLIKDNMLKNECSACMLEATWQGKEIKLHLDHTNGINTDNRIENLRLLCPNCHSQTDTYTGKNKGR
jgi:Zn finger protein HypA/HybF involved in hydrogenase expression